MSELILHIGAGRCGSTSIQKSIKKKCEINNNEIFFSLTTTMIDRLNILSLKGYYSKIDKYLEEFFKTKSEKIYVSQEYLFCKPLAIFSVVNFFYNKNFNIKIVGYSRNQFDWLSSFFHKILIFNVGIIKSINNFYLEKDVNTKYIPIDIIFFLHEIENNFLFTTTEMPMHLFWNQSFNYLKKLMSSFEKDENISFYFKNISDLKQSLEADFFNSIGDKDYAEEINKVNMPFENQTLNHRVNNSILRLFIKNENTNMDIRNLHSEFYEKLNYNISLDEQILQLGNFNKYYDLLNNIFEDYFELDKNGIENPSINKSKIDLSIDSFYKNFKLIGEEAKIKNYFLEIN